MMVVSVHYHHTKTNKLSTSGLTAPPRPARATFPSNSTLSYTSRKWPHQEGRSQSWMGGSPRRQHIQQCWPQTPHCRTPRALRRRPCKPECGTRVSQRKHQMLPNIRDTHVIGAQPSTLQVGLGQLPQQIIPILAARFAKKLRWPHRSRYCKAAATVRVLGSASGQTVPSASSASQKTPIPSSTTD